PLGIESFDLLVAEPLYVHGVARGEMFQTLDRLSRADEAAGAAAHDIGDALLIDFADRRRTTDRANLWKDVWLGPGRPFVEHRSQHLRNHVAGPLDNDRVADADVFAGDLVFVVQRRVLHHDPADRHRLELR